MKLLYTLLYSLILTNNLYSVSGPSPQECLDNINKSEYSFVLTTTNPLSNNYINVDDVTGKNLCIYGHLREIRYDHCIWNSNAQPFASYQCRFKSFHYTPFLECPNGEVKVNGFCAENPCDETKENYQDNDCDGDGIPNYQDEDLDGDGVPNPYDDNPNTPLTSEEIGEQPTCAEAKAIEERKCLIGQHSWQCRDNPLIIIKNSCNETFESPCDEFERNLKSICDSDSHIEGTCNDNGVQVTKNTFECLPNLTPPPICRGTINEILDQFGDECICKPGYTRNIYNRCTIPLDSNATNEQITTQQETEEKENEEITDYEGDIEQTEKLNEHNQDLLDSLDTNNDSLSGIREDLELMNDILGDVGLQQTEDGPVVALLEEKQGLIASMLSEYTTFQTNVTNHISQIETKFNDTKNLFSSSQNFQVMTGNTNNCLSFTFRGKQITFDLCSSFALFAPIVYFVLTIIFMVSTFRFMVTHLLKGLE